MKVSKPELSTGIVEVYFNGKIIYVRSYKCLEERKSIMNYFRQVFIGYPETVYFHLKFNLQDAYER